MIGTARIGLRDLAGLSRRLATSLEAGVDVRRVLEREANGRTPSRLRRRLEDLRRKVASGHSLADAVDANHDFFPPLFCEMTDLGEHTGHLSEVYRHLADHYEHQLRLRRIFLASITWPMVQLTAALLVIGVVIWVTGVLAAEPVDVLGFGLVGDEGLKLYVGMIFVAVVSGVLVYRLLKSSFAVAAPLQKALLRVPLLGGPLRTLALARLAWSMHLTLETGMPLRRALPIALRSTQNALYIQDTDQILRAIASGHEITEALAATGRYPAEFLERLRVGEESGRLPESMEILSRQYQEEALQAIRVLTTLAGFAVWALVALFIIFFILRLAMFYVGAINEAMNF